MKPYPIKRRRLPRPQVTRRQLHSIVGKAICDFLLTDPTATHHDDYTAQALIAEMLELLHDQPYR